MGRQINREGRRVREYMSIVKGVIRGNYPNSIRKDELVDKIKEECVEQGKTPDSRLIKYAINAAISRGDIFN